MRHVHQLEMSISSVLKKETEGQKSTFNHKSMFALET